MQLDELSNLIESSDLAESLESSESSCLAEPSELFEPSEPESEPEPSELSEPHLLKIQALDTEIEQLSFKLDGLPLKNDLRAAQAEQAAQIQRVATVWEERAQKLVRQKRFEGDAAVLEAKADEKHDLLYSGEVVGLKDLQALQKEIDNLREQQSVLEDIAIEALIEADDLAEQAKLIEQERSSLDEKVIVLEMETAVATEAIEQRITEATAARDKMLSTMELDVSSRYQRLRPFFGHSTAVSFDVSSGCGCPTRMPTSELVRIRGCKPGSIQECGECGRMVVR